MTSTIEHLTLVIGASPMAGGLRRALQERGIPHAEVTSHLRGVRRLLVRGDHDLVVLCIVMDEPTLDRYGVHLRSLLRGHDCYPTELRTVGLLTDLGLTSEAAGLGCDLYVDGSGSGASLVDLLDAELERPIDNRPGFGPGEVGTRRTIDSTDGRRSPTGPGELWLDRLRRAWTGRNSGRLDQRSASRGAPVDGRRTGRLADEPADPDGHRGPSDERRSGSLPRHRFGRPSDHDDPSGRAEQDGPRPS